MTGLAAYNSWKARQINKLGLKKFKKRERDRKRDYRNKLTVTGDNMRRFIALDGEGAGTDELLRQQYMLLRAGDATGRFSRGVQGAPRLTTEQCLEFILSLPRDAILIGFYFNYDITHILMDMYDDPHTFHPEYGLFAKNKRSRYTFWKNYGIEYVPSQYFRVCRLDDNNCSISGSARTVNETKGFFQKSLVAALEDWSIGTDEERLFIKQQKERRNIFDDIGDVEAAYCATECRLTAQLMETFRDCCKEGGIMPQQWRGAGHLAARMHKSHGTPMRGTKAYPKYPKILVDMAQEAYYGGRFEVTTIGRVTGDVFEYDIRSAYPSAMLQLPCPKHTNWRRMAEDELVTIDHDAFFVADIDFSHSRDHFLCGFPFRTKTGHLMWPIEGQGTYWSPEIKAAVSAGANVSMKRGFICDRRCDCLPYAWVEERYKFRKTLEGKRGDPIKLGINALYGKFAQRIGVAPYHDFVVAGLITAITRAKLINAYTQDPTAVVYIATDALHTTRPLTLSIGDDLGQWECKKRTGQFMVQPGIYWSDDAEEIAKTRGIPKFVLKAYRVEFEEAWREIINQCESGYVRARPVPVFIDNHIGIRLAQSWGKPWMAGRWLSDVIKDEGTDICNICTRVHKRTGIRHFSFDWRNKRSMDNIRLNGRGGVVTQPIKGDISLRSHSFDSTLLTELAHMELEQEALPDKQYMPYGGRDEELSP